MLPSRSFRVLSFTLWSISSYLKISVLDSLLSTQHYSCHQYFSHFSICINSPNEIVEGKCSPHAMIFSSYITLMSILYCNTKHLALLITVTPLASQFQASQTTTSFHFGQYHPLPPHQEYLGPTRTHNPLTTFSRSLEDTSFTCNLKYIHLSLFILSSWLKENCY